MNDTGRPEGLFYNGDSVTNLRHEHAVTQEVIPFWKNTIRGNRVDSYLKPDFTIVFDKPIFGGHEAIHGEVDLGTEGIEAKVAPQMEKYRRRQALNVWFAPTQKRLDRIKKVGTEFSMYSICGSRVWVDHTGKTLTVAQLRSLCHTRSA